MRAFAPPNPRLTILSVRKYLVAGSNLSEGHIKSPRDNWDFLCGTPGRIRTHDLDVRTVLLYPLSYRGAAFASRQK